jgi:L-asparaginase
MDLGGVVLFTLGGTIAMAGHDGGVVARLSGRDLVAGAGKLDDEGADVEVRDLRAVPSADLSFVDILDAIDAAGAAVAAGACGIVLTQGTDTLEESAFLIDAVWAHDAPFIVTGAMRNPTLPGADGPANVLAAIQVAAAPEARRRGALVVFNDEIHAARHVRKSHSASTATCRIRLAPTTSRGWPTDRSACGHLTTVVAREEDHPAGFVPNLTLCVLSVFTYA